jgi:two-component system, chemotaxis family, sensor kinase Cph1
MDNEKMKEDKLRKKAEKVLQNQFNPIKNQNKNLDEVIYELRVHQIELEMQNEELRKSRIELEDSRWQYFELYDLAPVGYLTIDAKGLIKRVNLTVADILGMPRENLINSTFISYISPNYRGTYHKHTQEVLKSQTKQQCEIELVSNNKTPLFASLYTMVVNDEDDDFKEFRIILTDVTEHKKVEDAFAKKKEELQTIFDSSRSFIFYKDKENRLLQVNKAFTEIMSMPKEKLEGVSLFDIFPKEQAEAYWKDDKEVMESERSKFNIIEPMPYSDGIRYVQTDKIPYRDVDGNIIGIMGFSVDITERKKTEEELERAMKELERSNKELSQFAYVASHDLKEPLRMITSFLQLLQKRYSADLDEDANDFIDFAVNGSKRLDAMINDLLEYSRIGSQERKFEYLQSEKILETVLINLKQLIERTNASITHDPLPLIFANEQMMIQLFQNLIGNAIKYHGKENPEIHISAESGEDEYIFSIKDNGIGIDPKHLEKIFTIFQRLHSRDEYDGTGIGLAISKRILQKHNGEIWAESELGKGSTFYFTLPNRNY